MLTPALMSASACLRFKPLGSDAMLSRLSFIAEAERVSLAPGTLQTLSDVSLGDMRKAVTLLQSAAALYGGRGDVAVAVAPEHVRDVAGIIPADAVHALLAACRAGAGAFDAAQAAVEALVKEGYPALQVLAQLTEALIEDDSVSDAAKATVAARAAAADKRLADGADEGLQLLDVAAAAQRALAGLPPAGGATLTAG
jgi:replication factor C subunit 2/4